MLYNDLRGWLARLDDYGELTKMDGVPLGVEVGALHEMALANRNCSAVLFDKFAGYPAGYRIAAVTGTPRTRRGNALTLDLPETANELEMTQVLRQRLKELKPIPPRLVETGPIMENVHLDADVNLLEFPVPKWHELDGGEYMGTGDLVITRDPEEDWVNVGTYRVQRHDKDTLGFYISPGKHGRIHREKYFGKGEPCPVAISFGQDPLLAVVAAGSIPWGLNEYAYAGGLRGEPVEVIKAPVTGLPIPASAEIVIEGESYPGETRLEGPFGEFTGYYGSGERQEPIIHVKSILHRNDPILLGMPPIKPGGGASHQIMRAATIWNGLERTGIPDIVGVASYVTHFYTVVSIRQRYPGHSRQVAAVAGQLPGAAYCGRWVIVVDEDIDPTNFDEVMWAMATRCDPALSFDLLHRSWSTPLDPMSNTGLAPDGPRMFNSRVIVDACIPYELKNRKLFPAIVGASPELRAKMKAEYGDLLE